MEIFEQKINQTKQKWNSLKSSKQNSMLRIRDAANILGVSEAELLSTNIGDSASYLKIHDFKQFINVIKNFSSLMILSRNDIAVHEIISSGEELVYNEESSTISSQYFSIKLKSDFFSHVFSEKLVSGKRQIRSFQFFDENGQATLKIYQKSHQNDLYNKIVSDYKSEYNYEFQKRQLETKIKSDFIDDYFDQFSSTIPKKISSKTLFRRILENFSSKSLTLEVKVFSERVIQTYYGKIKKVVDFKGWFNILDSSFNLHVQDDKFFHEARIFHDFLNDGKSLVVFSDKNKKEAVGIVYDSSINIENWV